MTEILVVAICAALFMFGLNIACESGRIKGLMEARDLVQRTADEYADQAHLETQQRQYGTAEYTHDKAVAIARIVAALDRQVKGKL